ncbi:MAG: DMT family transporter [Akkermansiaceae bacterium]|nr:DMT family transporter [Akkermansiaceae bacterium]
MNQSSNSRVATIELHAAVFLFGISGLFGKLIPASALIIVLGRTAFAALTIVLGLKIFSAEMRASSRKSLVLIAFSGVLLALHWLTFFHAIQVSTVAIGLIGYATFPIFVTFLEPLLSSQRVRAVDVLSAVVVVIGLVLVAPRFDLSDSGTVGLIWAVVSGALFAMLTLHNRILVKENSVLVVALYQHASAALLLLPVVFIQAEVPQSNTVLLLLILGVFCTALPQILFIKSLAILKAQFVSIVAGLEPVYGILFAAVFLSEIPELQTVIGACLVFGAVVIAMRAHANSDKEDKKGG